MRRPQCSDHTWRHQRVTPSCNAGGDRQLCVRPADSARLLLPCGEGVGDRDAAYRHLAPLWAGALPFVRSPSLNSTGAGRHLATRKTGTSRTAIGVPSGQSRAIDCHQWPGGRQERHIDHADSVQSAALADTILRKASATRSISPTVASQRRRSSDVARSGDVTHSTTGRSGPEPEP
jgi:hypothetical protein